MLSGSRDGRGVQGRMDTCVCMEESFCYVPKTVITLVISYTPKETVVVVWKRGKAL